jgi:ABC-type multidrug transport system permease subunit
MRLRAGKTDLIVVPSAKSNTGDGSASDGQSAQGRTEGKSRYEYRFDPTRPQSVLAQSGVDDQLQRAAGRRDAADKSLVEVDEPGGRYIDFLVPGLLGMSLMGGGLWGVGFVIVDMRVRKLLKRFLATPMKKSDFMAAIMGSRMIFMVPEVLFLLLFARYVFGVVNHGSVIALIVIVLLGAIMFSGLGLLIASRANTIEAVSGMMNLVMVPMWIFSGIFFSSERFPEVAQPFIKAIPLTPLIDALRSVMLEGAPLSAQLTRIGTMAAWGVASFILALRWFRWR